MKFNEDSRVKTPTILHLIHLGYDYLSLRDNKWDGPTISSFFNKMAVNIKDNQKLSELRDWLLPMLMNGQVRVGEREEMLSMAAEPEVKYGK